MYRYFFNHHLYGNLPFVLQNHLGRRMSWEQMGREMGRDSDTLKMKDNDINLTYLVEICKAYNIDPCSFIRREDEVENIELIYIEDDQMIVFCLNVFQVRLRMVMKGNRDDGLNRIGLSKKEFYAKVNQMKDGDFPNIMFSKYLGLCFIIDVPPMDFFLVKNMDEEADMLALKRWQEDIEDTYSGNIAFVKAKLMAQSAKFKTMRTNQLINAQGLNREEAMRIAIDELRDLFNQII